MIPRLFAWPPVASAAQAIERASIALLVSSAVFEFATGIINAQNYYPFDFRFVAAHYYGAVVFVASLAVHIVVKLPVMVRAYRERGLLMPLREDLAHTRPEPADPDGLVASAPAAPTITRRGLLGFVGAGSALLLFVNVGESIGGPLRRLSLLAPRSGDPGPGPNGFQVNKTAAGAGIKPAMTGDGLPARPALGRPRAAPQPRRAARHGAAHGGAADRLRRGVDDHAALDRRAAREPGGARSAPPRAASCSSSRCRPGGTFRQVTLTRTQFGNERALLALKVNGADLSLDHGFPARVIVPALPGVHNTKWVAAMTFKGAA